MQDGECGLVPVPVVVFEFPKLVPISLVGSVAIVVSGARPPATRGISKRLIRLWQRTQAKAACRASGQGPQRLAIYTQYLRTP
jgi:hypothetical protein